MTIHTDIMKEQSKIHSDEWQAAYKAANIEIQRLTEELNAFKETMERHASMLLCDEHANQWGGMNDCPVCRAEKAESELAALRATLPKEVEKLKEENTKLKEENKELQREVDNHDFPI